MRRNSHCKQHGGINEQQRHETVQGVPAIHHAPTALDLARAAPTSLHYHRRDLAAHLVSHRAEQRFASSVHRLRQHKRNFWDDQKGLN